MTSPCPANSLFDTLVSRYGYLIGGDDLWRLLAFSSAEAFKKAKQRNAVPVEVFHIEGRRTRFARTADVATWLETQLSTSEKGGPA
jgi:hypothetical protein